MVSTVDKAGTMRDFKGLGFSVRVVLRFAGAGWAGQNFSKSFGAWGWRCAWRAGAVRMAGRPQKCSSLETEASRSRLNAL